MPAIRVLISLLCSTCLFFSCQTRQEKPVVVMAEESIDLSAIGKNKLSEYGFFAGALKELQPSNGVIPYTLNSPLFSDYAYKARFIKLPEGQSATYQADEVFEFPVGTILIKNFYYPADFQKPEKDWRILETRLLIHEAEGWKALPYIWNDEQTEAYLEVAGKSIPVSWTKEDGQLISISYSVPNMNQCKGCHLRGDKIFPIGPTARQLNKKNMYARVEEHQLLYWQKAGILKGLPDLNKVPRLAAYENEQEALDLRARAWLEVNCAHCHRADGPAKTSGLHLLASEKDPHVLGIGKAPVAAGKGSGGRLYGIVPGKPDESILQFRIESTHPGIMMPELGRQLTHIEGVELVRQWITEMK
jgi:uncharacterized repeat protein (TIGR03806 family)